MKVIIAGSRSIGELFLAYAAVHASGYEVTEEVCGCAPGMDGLGSVWALQQGVPSRHFPASDYPTPNLRNQAMAEYADALVAVWDGKSPGTKDMVGRMLNLGKPTFQATWTTKRRPLVKRSGG